MRKRTNPDARLFTAAARLVATWEQHAELCDLAWDKPEWPPECRASRKKGVAAGKRFASIPAQTIQGLALKVRFLVNESMVGPSAWGEELAATTLADAERLALV